jgi:hypothetical protein
MYRYFLVSITFLFIFISLVEADIMDGLVLYLPFDEGKGDVTQDMSPNKFTGVITGAKWGKGKFGNALTFDGDGDFVEIPFNKAFDIKGGITMAAWVTANIPFSPEWRIIINAKKSAQGPWGLQTRAAANLETFYDVAGVRVWASSVSTMERDVFHQVAGTYDKDKGFSVYFDGKLEPGAANSGNLNTRGEIDSPAQEGVVVGHNYNSAGRWWNGTIDEVMIYNRALSENEMAQLFKAPPMSKAVELAGKLTTVWGNVKK